MPELVWIIDPISGDLVVEGLEAQAALALASDLLPCPKQLNCAQPVATVPLPRHGTEHGPLVRVEAVYHWSVVEGPGRRSVLQVRGCPLRCRGFIYSTSGPTGRPSDGHARAAWPTAVVERTPVARPPVTQAPLQPESDRRAASRSSGRCCTTLRPSPEVR